MGAVSGALELTEERTEAEADRAATGAMADTFC